MEITGSYTFNASREQVWNLLMDANAIAKAIPGVQAMIPIEGEPLAWKAVAKIGIASVSGTYSGYIRMSDVDPMKQYRLTVSGEGQQSIINGTALLKLEDDSKGVLVNWTAEANIAGKLAGIAQRVVKAAAGLLSRQFFSALARQLPQAEASNSLPTNLPDTEVNV
jgi:carbon monoxide dehydrogenase subunit G